MRRKLNPENKKMKLTTSINPTLYKKLFELYPNVSKHIEQLVYNDMVKNNIIEKIDL